ncbi:hypothetical protein H6F43_04010 [Leptolyngbya sp. FACHB-36]|uniref:hypothetical protein n=1 Tax=Leptolyngbya sp. FACHB-36 TaxID=2692808 RepID=UPI0016811C2F|nr:hypothetical protein [Leptolyngbya sp. FACHB-36]MBD2019348.1 hypothetical protein [Leptolyngbya sp. FACHB-36]
MADETNVEIQLGLSTEGLKQGLTEAEQLMQQGVERMNGLGQAPVAPPPVPAQQSSTPTQTQPSPNPIAAAHEELERIRGFAQSAPDVALASLKGGDGSGGLQHRVLKAAVANPEEAESYQQLLGAIRDLTRSIQDETKTTERAAREGGGVDGATSMLRLIRGNVLMNTAGMVGGAAMSGNVLGAGGAAIGGLLGMLGGPMGSAAGAQMGAMLGNSVGGFLAGTDEARQYSMMTADISARFGDFGQESGIKPEAINAMKTSGYSERETAQLFDSLRDKNVIDRVDGESTTLVESIQALTRATGLNTDALVNSYSTYRTGGGEADANTYMGQIVAGAVSAGMRENLQQYQELLGSASQQLVYRSGQADVGDGGMRAIQGTLTNLMSGQSRTAELLRENPMMAQQVLSGFLASGGSQQYSFDSAAMQMAGVARGRTDTAYATPEQQAINAATRMQSVINNVIGGGATQILGMDRGQITEAIKADPNFLQSKVSSSNPNAPQAAALQDLINVQFRAQYGRMPTAQDIQLFTQLGSNAIANGGQIDLNAPTGEGDKTIADLITESQKTEGQMARDAAAERHQEMLQFMNRFAGFLTAIDQGVTQLLQVANTVANFLGIGKPASSVPTGSESFGNLLMPSGGTSLSNPLSGFSLGGSAADIQGIFKPQTKAEKDADLKKIFAPTFDLGVGSLPAGKPEVSSLQKMVGPVQFDFEGADAAFNDTPPEGVLARPGFNVFEFAPGDVVHASQGGVGMSSNSNSATVNITVNLSSSGDPETVRSAARSGTQAGTDEFLAQWEAGRLQARNQPRIRSSSY